MIPSDKVEEDVFEFGIYNEKIYYFESKTYLSYYLIGNNNAHKTLDEAIENEWISLEELISFSSSFNLVKLKHRMAS